MRVCDTIGKFLANKSETYMQYYNFNNNVILKKLITTEKVNSLLIDIEFLLVHSKRRYNEQGRTPSRVKCHVLYTPAIYLGTWDLWLTSLLEASNAHGSMCHMVYKRRVSRHRYDRNSTSIIYCIKNVQKNVIKYKFTKNNFFY